MSRLTEAVDELVRANRILAFEGIVDGWGHVSMRHPEKVDHFLLSRARSPQCVEPDDIMEFRLNGDAVDPRERTAYTERFIHAALYQSRPEVTGIVHSHSLNVIPFGVGGEKIRPMMHVCALIGHEVPIWDSRDKFGDTDMMVSNMEMGHDLARLIGSNPTALMRGHGSVALGKSLRRAVYVGIKLHESARLQAETARYSNVRYLSPGEIDKMAAALDHCDERPLLGIDRAWEYWCHRAGMPFKPST